MTERSQKAYNSLVKAFYGGTLAKFSCLACACGNIIHDAIGKPITKQDLEDEVYYIDNAFENVPLELQKRHSNIYDRICEAEHIWAGKRTMTKDKYVAFDYLKSQVNEAGYTAEEFAIIENAFESNTCIKLSTYRDYSEQEILEDQYKGLSAVVDVLLELDNDKEQSPEELKQKFKQHPKMVAA